MAKPTKKAVQGKGKVKDLTVSTAKSGKVRGGIVESPPPIRDTLVRPGDVKGNPS